MKSLVAPAWMAAAATLLWAPAADMAASATKRAPMRLASAGFRRSGAWAAKWPSRTWPSSWASTNATSSSDIAWSSRPNATTIEPSGSE